MDGDAPSSVSCRAVFTQSGMHFPDPQAQFWMPYVPPAPDSRNRLNVAVMARLAAGVSLPAAEDVINTASAGRGRGRALRVVPRA